MTNGDRLRQMTDEELAIELPDSICRMVDGIECTEFDLSCYECRLMWLKQEVDQDDSETV